MKFKKLFLNCDLFGKTQNFTIATKSSYQTYFGSAVSLVVVGVLTYLFFYFGLEIFDRARPNVIITTYNEENPPETLIDDSSNIFTLALENPDYTVYINESIYTLNASMITIKPGESGLDRIIEPITLMKCSEYNFKFLNDYFEPLDLPNLYCLNTSIPYMLKGEFSKAEWKYLQFQFNKCVNSTKNNNSCMSTEEIESRLQGGYLGMFISHVSVMPTNFHQPFSFHGKNVFTSFSSNQYTDVWMYLKPLIIETDDGYIFRRNKTVRCLVYDSSFSTYDYRGGNTFLSLNLRLSLVREVYERSYSKVQGVAAEIGGIIKFGLVVGEIVVYIIREILYKDFLLTFFFEEPLQKVKISNSNLLTSVTGMSQRNGTFKKLSDTTKTNNYLLGFQKNKKLTKKDLTRKENINSEETKSQIRFSLVNSTSTQRNNSQKKIRKTSTSTSILVNAQTPSEFQNKTAFKYIMSLFCFICNNNVRKKVKRFNNKFSRVSMLFDVIYYLKEQNEISLLKKKLYINESITKRGIQYQFELPSIKEQELFKYYISLKRDL